MYSVQCIGYINPYLLVNHEDFTFGIFIVRLISSHLYAMALVA